MKLALVNLKPGLVLKVFACLLLFANIILFILRSIDSEWWLGDYKIYSDVATNIHFLAIAYFCIYLAVYFLILRRFFSIKFQALDRRSLSGLFWFVALLFLIQTYFAIFLNVGVASETGRAPAIAYVLFLFSFDGVYYAYALKEKNKGRLLWATLFYIVSNVARGWAGFVLFLGAIYFLRQGVMDRKKLGIFLLTFIIVMPVLFVVRDLFRGGYSNLDYLKDGGLSGAKLYSEFFLESLKMILVRFDFYSNYIGVGKITGQDLTTRMCLPIQENIFFKVYIYFDPVSSCTSLGSILPGSLYDYFRDKGTSYSVASGFFALPFEYSVQYFLSYIFVLCLFAAFVKNKMNSSEYVSFFILLVFLLLFQGWMYQFIHNMLGFLVGWVLSRITWKREETFQGGQVHP